MRAKPVPGVVAALCAALLINLFSLPAAAAASTAQRVSDQTAQTQDNPAAVSDWTVFRSIAHCLGTVDGQIYTNSKEAFEQSYEAGFRVFEADLAIAADGVLVVRHDFDANSASNLGQPGLVGEVTSEQHLSTPILEEYTALDAVGLLELLAEHPDAWLVTDTKQTDPDTVRQIFAKLVAAARQAGGVELLDRVIVQIYNTELKDVVEECWPFDHWILTTYLLPADSDYGGLAGWCTENGVPVLAMPAERVTAERVAAVMDQGVRVYVHTLNDPQAVSDCLALEVDGVYSDLLTPMEVSGLVLDQKWSAARELFHAGTVKLLEAASK